MGNSRTTNPTTCLLVCTAVLWLSPLTVAQATQPSTRASIRPSRQVQKQARKWVTFLELTDRRAEGANALLKMGKLALPALIQGLEDPRPVVVQRVAQILRALGADALPAKAKLEELAKSENAQLAHAAAYALAGVRPAGLTLVANYSGQSMVELDKDGKVVRTLKAAKGPWDAERLANGNYLITDYTANKVIEVTREDKVVWSYAKLKNPYKADRLASGNTLIADYGNGRIVEVSPKGEIVWKYDKDKLRAHDVQRLVNGNTLIVHSVAKKIVEVTPEGKVVWTYAHASEAMDVDRLANGNTLIAFRSAGIVREVDPSGKTVNELKGLGSPSDADRLPNGHTIVAERNAVVEYDAKGKKLWSRPAKWPGEVNRY